MPVEILANDGPPEVYEFTGDKRLWDLMQRGLLDCYQVAEMSKWSKECIERALAIANSVADPSLFNRLMEMIEKGEQAPEKFFAVYPNSFDRQALYAINAGEISMEKAILLSNLPTNEQRYLLEGAKSKEVDDAAFAISVDSYLATDPEYRAIIATLDENFDGSARWAGAYDADEGDEYAAEVEAERKRVKDYIDRLYSEAHR